MNQLEKTELIRKAKSVYRETDDKQYGYILEDGSFLNVEGTHHQDVCNLWQNDHCSQMDIIQFQKSTQAIRVRGSAIQIHQDTPITRPQEKRLLEQCQTRLAQGDQTRLDIDIVDDQFKVIGDYSFEVFNCKKSVGEALHKIREKKEKI